MSRAGGCEKQIEMETNKVRIRVRSGSEWRGKGDERKDKQINTKNGIKIEMETRSGRAGEPNSPRTNAHLELSEREPAAQAHPMPVHKREQMPMPLHLLRPPPKLHPCSYLQVQQKRSSK